MLSLGHSLAGLGFGAVPVEDGGRVRARMERPPLPALAMADPCRLCASLVAGHAGRSLGCLGLWLCRLDVPGQQMLWKMSFRHIKGEKDDRVNSLL